MNRRDFLKRSFKLGGAAALASFGLSPKEIQAFSLDWYDGCQSCPTVGQNDLTFCWDGEHASGSNYATGVSGNLAGTETDAGTNVDIGPSYAYCGSNGLYLNTSAMFAAVVDADNRIYALLQATGEVLLRHEGNTNDVNDTSVAQLTVDAWNRVYYSWSVAEGKIAIKINEGSWEETAGTVTDFSISVDFRIGSATNNLDWSLVDGTDIDAAAGTIVMRVYPDAFTGPVWYDNVQIYSTFEKEP